MLVLDIFDSHYSYSQPTLIIEKGAVNKIRSGQYKTEPPIVRIVVHLREEEAEYEVFKKDKHIVMSITSFRAPEVPPEVERPPVSPLPEELKEPEVLLPPKEVKKPEIPPEIEKPEVSPPKPEKSKALPPPEKPLFSMDSRDAEIRDILRVLAEKGKLNVVTDTSVAGRITIYLKDVSVEEALELILRANGYAYQKINNSILVATPEKLKLGEARYQPTTKMFILKYAKAEEVKTTLTDLLSPDGKILVDKDLNALIVCDSPLKVKEISKYLGGLDPKPPQVLIEAKIVEVTLRKDDRFGVNWERLDFALEPDFTGKTTIKPAELGSTGLNLRIFNQDMDIILQALAKRTNINLLSSPRIVTLSNQAAEMSVATRYPIAIYSYNTDIGEWEITGWQMEDIGIVLKVTPRVTENRDIVMKVTPEVTGLTGEWVGTELSRRPVTSSRKTDTQVIIKDGQTLVIGGLIEEKKNKTVYKVPILGNIPLLGFLFRKTESPELQNVKTELVVFITPHILPE
jgi:type IV pilus assembly protein PilQ